MYTLELQPLEKTSETLQIPQQLDLNLLMQKDEIKSELVIKEVALFYKNEYCNIIPWLKNLHVHFYNASYNYQTVILHKILPLD